MPDWNERVDAEIDAYFRWLETLEAKASSSPLMANASSWYYGDLMRIYTRSTVFSSGMYGKRCVVLSNIEAIEAERGNGLFTELLQRLHRESGRFAATHLVIENVANPRFAEYLRRRGFAPSHCADTEAPSLARQLAPAPAAELRS